MECCHAKRVGTDLRAVAVGLLVVQKACKFILQIIPPGISRLVCVRGAALIMITQRQGGQVTLVLLTLKGASFDHHENHLRPQYNLSVFCHMNKKHAGLRLRLFTQTQMAQDVHCQYLATIVETEMEPRVSCRVCCKCSASPITNTADLQMLGDLLSFSIFCKNQNLSMKLCSVAQTRRCRTINISTANGRVLLILLPLVRATNDLFLFLSHLTLQAPANIWQRLKCSKLGIETGARSDNFFHRLIPF